MAYDERLAERVRVELADREDLTSQKMFGGIAYMLDGHMVCGVLADELIVRVGPDGHERALGRAHTRPMDWTGRPMRGIVVVEGAGVRTARQLRSWIETAVAFVATLPPKRPR